MAKRVIRKNWGLKPLVGKAQRTRKAVPTIPRSHTGPLWHIIQGVDGFTVRVGETMANQLAQNVGDYWAQPFYVKYDASGRVVRTDLDANPKVKKEICDLLYRNGRKELERKLSEDRREHGVRAWETRRNPEGGASYSGHDLLLLCALPKLTYQKVQFRNTFQALSPEGQVIWDAIKSGEFPAPVWPIRAPARSFYTTSFSNQLAVANANVVQWWLHEVIHSAFIAAHSVLHYWTDHEKMKQPQEAIALVERWFAGEDVSPKELADVAKKVSWCLPRSTLLVSNYAAHAVYYLVQSIIHLTDKKLSLTVCLTDAFRVDGYFQLLQRADLTLKNKPDSVDENSRLNQRVSNDNIYISDHINFSAQQATLALARMMVLYTWIEQHLGMELLPYRRGAS